jgi:ketosteroid isomerase-like protein
MHANEKLVRDFHAAQARVYAGQTSAAALEALLSEDVVWRVPGRNAIAGEYRGRRAVLDYFTRRRRMSGDSLRVTVHRVLADDEVVMQLAGGRAELGGVVREWETVGVFRIAGGRIAECWLVPFDQRAFDEAWS